MPKKDSGAESEMEDVNMISENGKKNPSLSPYTIGETLVR